MSKASGVLLLQCAIPPVPWPPGKIFCLSLLAPGMESNSFFIVLTFQVWASTQPPWCLCNAICYSEKTTHTCTSGDPLGWSFSITSCWSVSQRAWFLDHWPTGWEEAALMEKLSTAGMAFLYCPQGNWRDFQIADNFKHKLVVHLSAPSTGRKGG